MLPCGLRLKNDGKSTENDDGIDEVKRGDERSSRSSCIAFKCSLLSGRIEDEDYENRQRLRQLTNERYAIQDSLAALEDRKRRDEVRKINQRKQQ